VEELANGLRDPSGVTVGNDGVCYVTESTGGRVTSLSGGKAETVIDGLQKPQGIQVHDDLLYIVDAGAKELVEYNMTTRMRRTIAANLPVGAPLGVTPKFLRGIPMLSGPSGPFAGIARGTDGTLYLSADADGSVLAVSPEQNCS
jgi:glucose/arabinose dehydrogenase